MTLEVRIAHSEEYGQIDALLPSAFNVNAKVVVSAHRHDELVGAGWLEALPRTQARDYLRMNIATGDAIPERESVQNALLDRLCAIAAEWGAGGVVLGGRSASEGAGAEKKRLLGFQPSRTIETFKLDLDHLEKALESSAINAGADWESRQPRNEDLASLRSLFPAPARQAIQQCTQILQVPELSRVLVEGEDGSSRNITGVLSIRSDRNSHRPLSSWRHPDQSKDRARFLFLDVLPSWRNKEIESLEFQRLAEENHAPIVQVACDAGAQCTDRRSFWIKPVEDFQSNE